MKNTAMHRKPSALSLLTIPVVVFMLVSCSLLPPRLEPGEMTATVLALTPTVIPPTATPLPPLAVLVTPQGVDQAFADEMEASMKTLAEAAGMRFQVRPSLATADLSEDMAIVVVLPPDPGLSALASSSPGVQFIAVGINGLAAGDNLSVIQPQDTDSSDLAFIAGFIAGVVTPDWRAGALLPSDPTTARIVQDAFYNGLHFWCGLCQPAYAPFVLYPQFSQVTDPADAIGTLARVDELTNMGVSTIYVPAEIAGQAVFEYIAEKPALIIATAPPPAAASGQWVVTLQTGKPLAAFEQVWGEVLRGNGGLALTVPLELAYTGSGIFNDARQRVVTEMLEELSKGVISAATVPD